MSAVTVSILLSDLRNLLDQELGLGIGSANFERHRRLTVAYMQAVESAPVFRLLDWGDRKIACIKAVRAELQMGLREAKETVETYGWIIPTMDLVEALRQEGALVSQNGIELPRLAQRSEAWY